MSTREERQLGMSGSLSAIARRFSEFGDGLLYLVVRRGRNSGTGVVIQRGPCLAVEVSLVEGNRWIGSSPARLTLDDLVAEYWEPCPKDLVEIPSAQD